MKVVLTSWTPLKRSWGSQGSVRHTLRTATVQTITMTFWFLSQSILPWWLSGSTIHGQGAAGDLGLLSGSGRSPGEGNGDPLQYSCLENSMDRGPWGATVYGVAENRTWQSDWHFHFSCFFWSQAHWTLQQG